MSQAIHDCFEKRTANTGLAFAPQLDLRIQSACDRIVELIELAVDLSCTNQSDNEVDMRIVYVTARMLVLVSSLRTLEIMNAICSLN